MPRILQFIFAPVVFGTRFHGPLKPDEPRMFSFALALQPVVGLLLGFAAAVLPLFLAAGFRGFQGLVLFGSGIYLFLLEWLTRFDHLHEFDSACRMLAGAGISPEERIRRRSQPGSSPCTALLIGLKLLLLYLIFLKTALFGDLMMLAVVLMAVPFLGRIAMLYSYPSGAGKGPSAGIAVKILWTLAALVLLAFTVGMLRMYGGNFFSFRTMKLTMSGFHGSNVGGGVPPVIALVSLGLQDTFSFFASGYLTVMYWNTEASKKLRERPTPFFAGAVCETAELASLIIFLIMTDDLIF